MLVLGLSDMDAIMQVLQRIQATTPLLAYEFFSELAVSKVVEHAGVTRPFETQTPFYALIEFERDGEDSEAMVFEAVEACMEEAGVGRRNESKRCPSEGALAAAEDISETITRWTPYKNDISSTVSKVPELLSAVDEVVHQHYPDWEVCWYGHIGDGNLHLNILKPDTLDIADFKARCGEVSIDIFKAINALGGSVSAEHGVGTLKAPYLSTLDQRAKSRRCAQSKRFLTPMAS